MGIGQHKLVYLSVCGLWRVSQDSSLARLETLAWDWLIESTISPGLNKGDYNSVAVLIAMSHTFANQFRDECQTIWFVYGICFKLECLNKLSVGCFEASNNS